ncbi:hypothetical protein GCM10009646_12020 [Streptomyces aureus]
MLRPREGERPHRGAQWHPNHRRSPPSDNHWSHLTVTRNLLDRPCREAETPLPKAGGTATGLLGGDPETPRPDWLSDCGMRTERRRSWCILGADTRGFVTR